MTPAHATRTRKVSRTVQGAVLSVAKLMGTLVLAALIYLAIVGGAVWYALERMRP